MIVILSCVMAVILAIDYVFLHGLIVIPKLIIDSFSWLINWTIFLAIAGFLVWCFAEE